MNIPDVLKLSWTYECREFHSSHAAITRKPLFQNRELRTCLFGLLRWQTHNYSTTICYFKIDLNDSFILHLVQNPQ